MKKKTTSEINNIFFKKIILGVISSTSSTYNQSIPTISTSNGSSMTNSNYNSMAGNRLVHCQVHIDFIISSIFFRFRQFRLDEMQDPLSTTYQRLLQNQLEKNTWDYNQYRDRNE